MSAALDRLKALRLKALGGEDKPPPDPDALVQPYMMVELDRSTVDRYLECVDAYIRNPDDRNTRRRLLSFELMKASKEREITDWEDYLHDDRRIT